MTKHLLLYTDDPVTGGVAQYNHAILCGLAASGYQVSCVQSKINSPLISLQKALSVRHIWLEFNTVNDFERTLFNQADAQSILTNSKPDLIIFSDCCPLSNFAAKQVAIQQRIPYITVVGFVAPYLAKRFAVFLDELSSQYIQAQTVIAVSNENLALLHELFRLPKNKGQVIYYGRSAKFFTPPALSVRERLRQEFSIPANAVVCFTAARLELVKGYQYQLEAIKQLKQCDVWHQLYFVWAGVGNLEIQLKQMIEQLEVSNQVKLLGQRWDIPDWLDASDIFILPSESEGMPLCVMEAMAKGLPVIASAVSGIPEELGDAGKLLFSPQIDPKATVRELVTTIQAWSVNSQLRHLIGQACKQRAEEFFREERMIKDTVEVVEKILLQVNEYISSELPITRQQVANEWLNLPIEQLKSAYTGNLGKLHRMLLKSGIKAEVIPAEERNFVNDISLHIFNGIGAPNAINYLLAIMLYLRADQLLLPYDINKIPKWLLDGYLQFVFESPKLIQEKGEIERYYYYIQHWLDYVHTGIFSNIDSNFWQDIALKFSQNANFTPLYFTKANLSKIYKKRAQIIELALKILDHEIDYSFFQQSANTNKIRLGVICNHFNSCTETFSTIPAFEYLDRNKFEIFLYAIQLNGNSLEHYCQSRADKLVQLPGDLSSQVQTIRADDLDIMLIGTNVSAITNTITLLAMHRLARVQVTCFSSPVTTGIRNIDYYISGKLTEPVQNAQNHYCEQLITIDGTGYCFNYGQQPAATAKPTRQSLGIEDKSIIFISGANCYKIIPELRETWAKIIASVPNSVLILYPFSSSWDISYAENAFKFSMQEIFASYNIGKERVIILKNLPNRSDVKEYLKLGDVYLDSYPYSGSHSTLDPLEVGLPTVIMDGESLRSRQGAALLRELQITDLIVENEESYIKLAIALGTNPDLRQQKSNQIKQRMQANPSFLDSRSYSAQMGVLFQDLFRKHQESTLTENLKLRETNLIIFPDWSQPEENLYQEIANVLTNLVNHPNRQITLLVSSGNLSEDEVNFFVSDVAMNLLLEAELDVTDSIEIAPTGQLSEMQWQILLPHIHARIILENEDLDAIAALKAEIQAYQPYSLSELD